MNKKILIVEDEDSIRKALEFHLRKKGFDVICAADGEEGLAKTRQKTPDLIILDLILPKKTGEEVCKDIRKDKIIGAIPIIMLTAKSSDVDRIIGKVIGADSYIAKPFDINDLMREINRLIERGK